MKRPPFLLPLNQKELSRLYWELERRGAFATGEKFNWAYSRLSEEELFALSILETRYDPRLLAILVDLFLTRMPSIHPVRLKGILRETQGLATAAVLGEFVLDQVARPDQNEAAELFRYLMIDVSSEPTQLFYRSLFPIGGRQIQEVLEKPLWYFKKWGFLALDPPALKDRPAKGRRYLYDAEGRFRILKGLLRRGHEIRLRDYLSAIEESVSRQQALKDLRSLEGLRRVGKNRGARYVFVELTPQNKPR